MTTTKLTANGLGSIVMYSLSVDMHIPYADFFNEAEKNNVPLHLLPMPLSPVGAFKRATTGLKETFQKQAEPIFIKEVPSTLPNTIMRAFEKRIKSSKEDTIRMEKGKDYVPVYKPIVTIMFDVNTNALTYQLFEPEGRDIFKKVEARYNELAGMANIQQVRSTIQSAFRYYGSIQLRHNGGVNFIPQQHIKEWNNFTNFLDKFDGIEIMELNVRNDSHNKATLKNALIDDVGDSIADEIKKLNGKTSGSSDLSKLVQEFAEVLKENQSIKKEDKSDVKKLGKDALESMLNRYKETMEKVAVYKELLNTDLSVIDSQVELAKSQLMKLVEVAA